MSATAKIAGAVGLLVVLPITAYVAGRLVGPAQNPVQRHQVGGRPAAASPTGSGDAPHPRTPGSAELAEVRADGAGPTPGTPRPRRTQRAVDVARPSRPRDSAASDPVTTSGRPTPHPSPSASSSPTPSGTTTPSGSPSPSPTETTSAPATD